MSVHSAQLGHIAASSTGYTTIYTVPAGKRTIWKHVLLYNSFASANFADLVARTGTTVIGEYYVPLAANGTEGGSLSVDLWVVLNAGDNIAVAVPHASVRVLCSGTELNLSGP